jgi:hypothetical protein
VYLRAPAVFAISLVLTGSAAAASLDKRAQPSAPPLSASRYTLVGLASTPSALETFALRAAGARLVSRPLNVWRVRSAVAERLLPGLRATGKLEAAEPDLRFHTFGHLTQGDPLIPQEWWIPVVGADQAEPPSPRIPLTVLDTGLDMTHEEFASRPDTILLNAQVVVPSTDPNDEPQHGTAVSSVAAAPANGVGLVGVYPDARLQAWDFGDALLSDVIAGFDAATKHGRTVINISGGFFGYSSLLERAVDRAVARGALVVAAAGNDRQNNSRPAYPASLPHVLTVAATDENSKVAYFSSRSLANDVAAPGENIPVAVPKFANATGYDVYDGTSFSSPLVAGAAAWIWNARPKLTSGQVADVLRASARDVGPAGWDADTGYGIVNIPAALTAAVPQIDPGEPNDDVFAVKPHGLTNAGASPLTTRTRGSAVERASMDETEDPEDVYRIWLPSNRRVIVRVVADANVDLAVWGPKTASVFEQGAAQRRDLLAFSQRRGRAVDKVVLLGRKASNTYGYADVYLPRHTADASYTLTISTAPR